MSEQWLGHRDLCSLQWSNVCDCGPVKAAEPKQTKAAREINPDNLEIQAMDAALEADPPIIRYRKNNHGVMVAVSIDDPHQDVPNKPRPDRTKRLLKTIGVEQDIIGGA